MPHLKTASLVAALAATALAPAVSAAPGKATGVHLMASLNGSAEVPGPGDADGTGTFTGRLNVGQGKLCYTLTSAKLGTLTMAHIHAGKAGVAGPPVVTLKASSPAQTCMAVDKGTAQKLVAMPGDFYVNIHTADLPNGAIRGQLMKH